MKSIEDKLKLMLNNAISYAYERRTNFRGAYIKIYEEILSRFAELEKQVESLKCCGNCDNMKCYEVCNIYHYCGNKESKKYQQSIIYNNYCQDWQPDNLTREERET